MEHVVFSFGDRSASWSLFDQYLELRRQKFVDELAWSVWTDGRIEFDQYDNPHTFYSLVTHHGRVVAGARLIPADTPWHGWQNLLVDAHRGMIPAIPPGFLPPDFDFRSTFECSRLVVDGASLDAPQRREAMRLLVAGLVSAGRSQGARALLSLSPPPLLRNLRALGYPAEFVGDRYNCEDDRRAYRVLQMEVARISAKSTGFPRDFGPPARVA